MEITDNDSGTPSHLISVDEYINIQFRHYINIDKSFSIIPVEGVGNDFIIKDSFIIGIFDNDIINNKKLPLLQFLYITKDQFLKKSNYILNFKNDVIVFKSFISHGVYVI